MRLCACLGVGLDIIEPCGFVWDLGKIRRAGLDYIDALEWTKHTSWNAFHRTIVPPARLVALTTKSDQSLYDFRFQNGDILLMGRESAGLPEDVHAAVDARITIPMRPALRSLNVATAAALALGEALRQTRFLSQISLNINIP